jgi:excisionase family DNA binding protein
MDKLLTAKEVAERLAIGKTTVYYMIQRYELPAVRWWGTVRVRPQDLEEFIEQHMVSEESSGMK